jgi:lipopolysaccharide/colanic/teichoic acid biosynthesis glycosyltransferase
MLMPLCLVIAIAIRLHDGGPVFYRGERVGLGGRRFRIFKFRTMGPEANGPTSTAADDPRVTRLGRFLRSSKLDELPQLLNVLRGDMSLVGPRPQVPWAVALYTVEQQALLTVRPGLTDYASIVFSDEGERLRGAVNPDEEYLRKIAPEKIRLGLRYVQSRSFALDCRIVVATLWSLIGGDPGRVLGRSTMGELSAGLKTRRYETS